MVLTVSEGTLTAAADANVGLNAVSSGSSISLTGTEAALSTYLSTANKLVFNGTAGSYGLTLKAQAKANDQVLAETVKTVAVTAAQLPALVTSGAASASAAPTLALPSSFTVLSSNGEIKLASGAVGAGSETLTVVLALSGGTATGALSLSSALGNGSTEGVTSAGSGTATLTLSGTASALSAYLNTADRIRFNGAASATPYTLV